MRGAAWIATVAVLGASLPTQVRASERPRASVEVDTSDVGEAGPIIQRRVEERADVVLRDAEVLPGTEADARIKIQIHEITGEDPGFAFDLWVERRGEPVGERRRVECNLCTETEIVAKAETEIGAVIESLAAEPTPEGEEVGPEAPPDPMDPEPRVVEAGDSLTDDESVLGPKGKAGVGLLVAGLVTTGTGIGLAIPDWKPVVVDGDGTQERSTRPIGIGLASAGGALLVVGAVLLGLDRHGKNSRRPHAVLRPSRRGGTFGIAGRF